MKEVKILDVMNEVVDISEIEDCSYIGMIDKNGERCYSRRELPGSNWGMYSIKGFTEGHTSNHITKATQKELVYRCLTEGNKMLLFETRKEFFTWMAED